MKNSVFKFAKDVSIVIFTHNRASFVKRFVGSLESMNFGGHLIIAESSPTDSFKETSEKLLTIGVSYNIIHLHVAKENGESMSQSINNCIKEGTSRITTKYAMLSCDDDIPVPETLQKCEVFLNENKGYNGANGEYVWYDIDYSDCKKFTLGKLFSYTSYFWTNKYTEGRRKGLNASVGLEGNTVKERLIEFSKNSFNAMYVVVKSNTLKVITPNDANLIHYPHFSTEYNWYYTIAMAGKIKHFKVPQMIRQFHGENLSIDNGNHPYPTFLEAISSEYWSNDVKRFLKNLSKNIVYFSSCDLKEANSLSVVIFQNMLLMRFLNLQEVSPLAKFNRRIKSRLKMLKYQFKWTNSYKIYEDSIKQISKIKL